MTTPGIPKVRKKIEVSSPCRRRWISLPHRLLRRGGSERLVLLLLLVIVIFSSCAYFPKNLVRRYKSGFLTMNDNADGSSSSLGTRDRGAGEIASAEAAATAGRGQGMNLLSAAAAGTQQIAGHDETDSVSSSTRSTSTANSGSGSGVVEMGSIMTKVQQPIPFFGRNDAASMREMASHLDHLLEEYGKDLVRVVQGVDLIINGLEQQAEKEGKKRSRKDREMPGDGVRRLAAKLRRKLEKTPPRWQVNTDVLAWLLRPVPFVAGLPAPTPLVVPSSPSDSVLSPSAAAAAAAAADERRAVPVPAVSVMHGPPAETLAQALGGALGGEWRKGGGRESAAASRGEEEEQERGRDKAFNRTGFHSYDETHQIFTHILRDWTSEGDSVRAGVYDPLLRALDLFFGRKQQHYAISRFTPAASSAAASGWAGVPGAGAGGGSAWQDYRDHPPIQKKARRVAKILVPGAGLGRLAVEVAARGYASVHANELSPTMLSSCYWLMEALRAEKLPTGCDGGVEPNTFSSPSSPSPFYSTTSFTPSFSPSAAGSPPALSSAVASAASSSPRANGHPRGEAGEAAISGGSSFAAAAGAAVSGSAAIDSSVANGEARGGEGRRQDQEVSSNDRMRQGDGPASLAAGRERHSAGRGESSSQRSQGGGDDAAGAAEAGGGGAGWSSGSGGGGGGGGGSGWGTGAGGGSAGPGAGVGFDASGSDAGSEQEGKGNSARGTDERRKYCEFYPFLNDAPHNEMDGEARFRPVTFPDPAGRAVLARASGRLSFQSGEFTATYGAVGGPFEGVFDAIVTSFFVDTAPNVVEYVATIRRTLKPGGVWINCGPLHWHKQSALALSLDEMLALVAGSGFRLEAVERLPPCGYRVTDRARSLRVDEFKPVFWVAVLEGSSVRGSDA